MKTKMPYRPLGDRVIVTPDTSEDRTKSGLYIPDNAKEKPTIGIVVAAGPGLPDRNGKIVPLSVKAGDRVLYGRYAGSEIRHDGLDHIIVRESDILAVLA